MAWVFYARDQLESGGFEIGWLTGIYTLAYTVAVAALSRQYGRVSNPRVPLVLAGLALGVVALAPVLRPGFALLLLSTSLFGALLAVIWPLLLTWMSHGSQGRELSRLVGGFSVAWAPGLFIGPPLGGWLFELALPAPFIGSAVVLVAAAVLFVLAIRPAGAAGADSAVGAVSERPAATVGDSADAAKAEPTRAADSPPLGGDVQPVAHAIVGASAAPEGVARDAGTYRIIGWITAATVLLGAGATRTLLPLWGQDSLGLTESGIGALLLVRPALMAASMPVLGRLSFWHFRRWPHVATLLVAAAAMAGIALSRGILVPVLLLLAMGAASAMAVTSSMFHSMSGDVANRAGRAAVNEAFIAGGLIMGSVGSGFLYERGGMPLALGVMVAAMLAATAGQSLVRRRPTAPNRRVRRAGST